MNTWDMIRVERQAFADRLDALAPSDWDKPSLAAGWKVRDVVAHMTSTALLNPQTFFVNIAKSGFNFSVMVDKANKQLIAEHDDAALAALYRAQVNSTKAPPGPSVGWLGEAIVHGEDVTRSLGSYAEHPVEHVVAIADFYKKSNLLIGSKRRISGVQLVATDVEWRHGNGPIVTGPLIALVLAMTGRKVALDDLTGDGVEVLAARP